jgi:hypothetical protein
MVFVTSPKALSEPQLPTSMACMWSFGYDKRDSLVPHNVVEPKTRSKKKVVMQLDLDVQVFEIFLFIFLSTLCFEILLLLLEGVMLHIYFSLCSLIGAHIFFYASLSIYFSSFFSMTPFSFCKKRNLF